MFVRLNCCELAWKYFTLREAGFCVLCIGPCLDCDCTFPIVLCLYKKIEEVIMQFELGLVLQSLEIHFFSSRPSRFIAA